MAVAAEQALDAARHTLNQFFRWRSHRALGLHPQLHRRAEPRDQRCGTARATTSSPPTSSTTRSAGRSRHSRRAGVISLSRVASLEGYVDPDEIKNAMTPETGLVAMTHASNVLGTVQPIEAIAAIVREAGALLLVDAAQTGRGRADRSSRDADRHAGVPRSQITVRSDRHGGPLRRPQNRRQDPRPGAKEAPEATLRARLSPSISLICWKAGPRTCSVSRVSRQESPGLPKTGRRTCAERSRSAQAGRRLGKGPGGLARRWPMGPRIPRGRSLSLIVPDSLGAPGSRRHPRYELQHRRPPRLALRPYIHRASGTFPQGTIRLSPGAFNTRDDIQAFIDALSQITAAVGV